MNKRKLSLFASLGVSMFAIIAASVSTFAWFQATANVTIEASSSSTTITVTKPDDYTFYAYRGNAGSHTKTGTFATDFIQITDGNKSTYCGEFSGMNPGDIKSFALFFDNHTSGNPVSLSIDKLVSTDANAENASKHRYIQGTSKDINIGWAMDIYSMKSDNNSGYSTFVDSKIGRTAAGGTDYYLKGNFNSWNQSSEYALTLVESGHYQITNVDLEQNDVLKIYYPAGATDSAKWIASTTTWTDCGFTLSETNMKVSATDTYDIDYYVTPATSGHYVTLTSKTVKNDKFRYSKTNEGVVSYSSISSNIRTLSTAISIYSYHETNTSGYIFFSVVFSNKPTTWYRETDDEGTPLLSPSSNDTRYFLPNESNGVSNCYSGLHFSLDTLTFVF